MDADAVRAAYRDHASPHLARAQDELGLGIAESGRGATLRMADGTEVVDLASGGFGYTHPQIVEAVAAQVVRLPLSIRMFFNREFALLVQRIAELAPGDLAVSFFGAAGTEAVEGALKLAKGYHPERRTVVAATGAYHGGTTGSLSVCGVDALRAPVRESAPVASRFVPYGDAAALRDAVDDDTVAVILEPVQVGQGVVVPPPGYLRAAREACDAAGALLVLDEVTTGLGRTGRRWGADLDGVTADIMAVGASLGGGVLPMGAYVGTRRVNDKVYDKRDPLLHANTTGGNPAACVAALMALEVMVQEDLPGRAAANGEVLSERLGALQARYDAITDVSSVGNLGSLRLDDADLARAVRREAAAHGVIVRADGIVAGTPAVSVRAPLLTSEVELQRGLDALEQALEAALAPTARDGVAK